MNKFFFVTEALRGWTLLVLGLPFFFCAPWGAYAQSSPASTESPGVQSSETEATAVDELIRVLAAKGVLTREEAGAVLQQKAKGEASAIATLAELLKSKGLLTGDEAARIETKAMEGVPAQKTQIVTRGIKKEDREKMKAEIKEDVIKETKQEIKAYPLPDWVKRISFYGDMRLRYEGAFFAKDNASFLNPSNPTELLNSTVDQNLFRVRARLGATVEVNDFVEVGLRITTGNIQDPTSTDQTMGTYNNKFGVSLDLAYLKLTPMSGLTLIGGAIPNPWLSTEMIWFSGLTFDGFAANYRGKFSQKLEGFITAGAFPLQEIQFSSRDKWLFGGQTGLDFKPRKDLDAKIAVAYYYYYNTRGIANSASTPGLYDFTAPQFQQKGNTLFNIDPFTTETLALAAEYHELDIIGTFDIGTWDPVHIVFVGDYVNNLGFNQSEVAALTGNPDVKAEIQGYQFGLSVGYLEPFNFGNWRLYAYYRHLEADAVLDAFTDPYFHMGGTNAKGWIIGGELGLAKNLWLSTRWTTANEIDGPPFAVDVFLVDLTARF